MADSYVQVAVDGAGKLIDTETILEADGTTRHRQVVVLGDAVSDSGIAVINNGALTTEAMVSAEGELQEDVLKLILIELRVLNLQIASEFRNREDLAAMRNDPDILSKT
jgi:hypothetical protein